MTSYLYKTQKYIHDKWLLILLILFPIAGPVVKHWNSFFFILITLTAFYFLVKNKYKRPLYSEEKIIVWSFFLFFCTFIVSSTINGWTYIQTKELGVELNFLFFIPIYFLLKEYDFTEKAILGVSFLSIPVIFIFSLYEYIWILPNVARDNLYGAYSHLFIGPITALLLLMTCVVFYEWFKNKKIKLFLLLYGVMGLFVILFSQSRLALVTIIGGAFGLIFLLLKNSKVKIVSIVFFSLLITSTYQNENVKKKAMLSFNEIRYFFIQNEDNSNNSLGLRLEMWRSSKFVLFDSPLFGIGNGNYPNYIKKYTKSGLVSKHVQNSSQMHNSFVEAFVSKGGIGFLLLLIIFYYPMYLAWKNRVTSYKYFVLISIFTTSITLMSLGESMLINKNNGVTYLVLFIAVLFSSLIRKIKNINKTSL